MKPYPYQEDLSNEALAKIKRYGIVYLAFEERCGKTLTSILTVEKSKAQRCLVITKKKALDGWFDTLAAYDCEKLYTVVNYHGLYTQTKKLKKIKGKMEKVTVQVRKPEFHPDNFDVIIIDEAHAYLSAYAKMGAIAKIVQSICYEKPIILLSATPMAQGYQLLFHQLNMSKYSPFDEFANFYKFFAKYGIPEVVYTSVGQKIKYDTVKPEVWDKVKHLFITKTRAELDFEHEPEDIIHMVELDKETKELYNSCQENEMLFDDIPLDSSMKLRTTLHQIEGGVYKDEDGVGRLLPNTEKIEAIIADFGDTEDMVIFYHYKAELIKLRRHFHKTRLAQATSEAEGVDFSMYEHLVVYSMDFSTAKFSQRRARQANKKRATEIKVHFYLVKGAISEQVYETVALNKQNFVDKMYKRNRL